MIIYTRVLLAPISVEKKSYVQFATNSHIVAHASLIAYVREPWLSKTK